MKQKRLSLVEGLFRGDPLMQAVWVKGSVQSCFYGFWWVLSVSFISAMCLAA